MNQSCDFLTLPLDVIHPFPVTVRQDFAQHALEELADSIRENGLLQPVVLRPRPFRNNRQEYDLVCGERRWRASYMAGKQDVPAVIWQNSGNAELVAASLVENLCREDLTVIEEARGYKQLREMHMTQAQIATKVGRSQSYISCVVGLLSLPLPLQERLGTGDVTRSLVRTLRSQIRALPSGSRPDLVAMVDALCAEGVSCHELAAGIPVRVAEKWDGLLPETTRTRQPSLLSPAASVSSKRPVVIARTEGGHIATLGNTSATGETPQDALGKLVWLHPEKFGCRFVFGEGVQDEDVLGEAVTL